MPAGIPVATVAIGKAGAINAGLLAVQILSVGSAALKKKMVNYRKKQQRIVENADKELQKELS